MQAVPSCEYNGPITRPQRYIYIYCGMQPCAKYIYRQAGDDQIGAKVRQSCHECVSAVKVRVEYIITISKLVTIVSGWRASFNSVGDTLLEGLCCVLVVLHNYFFLYFYTVKLTPLFIYVFLFSQALTNLPRSYVTHILLTIMKYWISSRGCLPMFKR